MKFMQVTAPEKVLLIIKKQFQALEAEKTELINAGGRCLAETYLSPEDVPAFNRSTVDGYAVAARDTFGAGESLPALLEYAGEGLMGQAAPAIKNGQGFLVHTGGMLPDGADAVVMIEETDQTENMIQCYQQIAPGENVIYRGEDLKKSAIALEKGQLVRAPEIGLLASLGITAVSVHRQPLIGFFSSGDELVPAETAALDFGKIRDSNALALQHLAGQYGAIPVSGGILPDDFDTFLARSREMLAAVDFLVFSGGSSVGSRDFTARTMQALGKPGLLVEGISIQPGKPTLLADCGGKPVLGLPGHPVSALNIFAIFGQAVIRRLTGKKARAFQPGVEAVLSRNIPSHSGRTDYIRVKLEQDNQILKAVPIFGRSGMLRTLAEAEGLLIVDSAKEGLKEGEKVTVTLWE